MKLIISPVWQVVHCFWNVMAHVQKPDFVFRRNGRVHLNRRGGPVQSTIGRPGVRISGSNAGYIMFRGSVKSTGYPLYSPVSPSLPLPCVTVCHHISTNSDWRICSWPWQLFALGRADPYLCVTNNLFIPISIALGWRAVQLYACHITRLHNLVFCVLRVVHKLDIRLLQEEQLTNVNEWKEGHAVTETNIFDRTYIYVFPVLSFQVLREFTHTVQVNCNFSRKGL